MGTRLIEQEMYDDDWFCDLDLEQRSLLYTMICKCDHAGFLDYSERKLSEWSLIPRERVGVVLESMTKPSEGIHKVLVKDDPRGGGKRIIWLTNFVKVQRRGTKLEENANVHKGIWSRFTQMEDVFPEPKQTYAIGRFKDSNPKVSPNKAKAQRPRPRPRPSSLRDEEKRESVRGGREEGSGGEEESQPSTASEAPAEAMGLKPEELELAKKDDMYGRILQSEVLTVSVEEWHNLRRAWENDVMMAEGVDAAIRLAKAKSGNEMDRVLTAEESHRLLQGCLKRAPGLRSGETTDDEIEEMGS